VAPNRIIKESIGASETLAFVTADEERHFWRLVVQADDFGRFDARPHVIRSRAYSAMLDQVDEDESERRTLVLAQESVDLIRLYSADGRRYGYFSTWDKHQRGRATTSKWPEPPSIDGSRQQTLSGDSSGQEIAAVTRQQALSDVAVSVSVSDSVSDDVFVNGANSVAPDDDDTFSSRVIQGFQSLAFTVNPSILGDIKEIESVQGTIPPDWAGLLFTFAKEHKAMHWNWMRTVLVRWCVEGLPEELDPDAPPKIAIAVIRAPDQDES
jgi:hypothetical protein